MNQKCGKRGHGLLPKYTDFPGSQVEVTIREALCQLCSPPFSEEGSDKHFWPFNSDSLWEDVASEHQHGRVLLILALENGQISWSDSELNPCFLSSWLVSFGSLFLRNTRCTAGELSKKPSTIKNLIMGMMEMMRMIWSLFWLIDSFILQSIIGFSHIKICYSSDEQMGSLTVCLGLQVSSHHRIQKIIPRVGAKGRYPKSGREVSAHQHMGGGSHCRVLTVSEEKWLIPSAAETCNLSLTPFWGHFYLSQFLI